VRYVLSKIGLLLLTAWAAITVNFLLPRMMPGSPADAAIAKLSRNGTVSPATRAAIEAQLGVPGGSLWHQYVSYLDSIRRFDFGLSYTFFPQPVSELVTKALPYTVILVGTVTVLAFVLGTLIGIGAAWKRGTWMDSLPTLSGSFLSAFPYFWTGLLLLFFLGYQLRWFPTSGAYGARTLPGWNGAFVSDVLAHAVLPALTIVLASLGGWILGMRNMMVTVLGEDYVTVAEAKGLPPRRVMTQYAARNAVLPQLSSFALSLGFIVGGTLVMELVFSYPGVGKLLLDATTAKDYPLMQGLFLVITLTVLIANVLADVAYAVLDPRTRQTEG